MTINLDNLITVFNIFAGSGGVIGLYLALRTKRKIKATEDEKKKDAADAVKVIVDAASEQVTVIHAEARRARDQLKEEQAESFKWKVQFQQLENKQKTLFSRVEAAETCQTTLTDKIKVLEDEKHSLVAQIEKLTEQVTELQEENRRLKEERAMEKQIIS